MQYIRDGCKKSHKRTNVPPMRYNVERSEADLLLERRFKSSVDGHKPVDYLPTYCVYCKGDPAFGTFW